MKGRKEDARQLGWLKRGPICTLFALAWVSALTAVFGWRSVTSDLSQRTALQTYYWKRYLGTEVLAPVWFEHPFRMLCVADQRTKSRWAIDADVVSGQTENIDGEILPFALSDWSRQQGSTRLVLESPQVYELGELHRGLREYIYGGEDVWDWFRPGLAAVFWSGFAGLIAALLLAIPADYKRLRGLRYGRWVSGPELVSARRFNRRQRGQGVGFITQEDWLDRLLNRSDQQVLIPKHSESAGILLLGDAGSGESSVIRHMLVQIAKRGDLAIVYDPTREYLPQFYDPNRGDIVLNPLDARSPYWSPSDEFRHFAEAVAIAQSMFPAQPAEERLREVRGKIFAHLLRFRPTPQDLAEWISCPEEIGRRVRGSEVEYLISQCARQERESIPASCAILADSFRLLPNPSEAQGRWTTADWVKHGRGWVFLTSAPSYREQVRPLASLWLDLLILRRLEQGRRDLPAWFFLGDLTSLHPLSQLPTALREKSHANRFVLGVENITQFEASYGVQSAAILSGLATKIFLRTSDLRTAQWGTEMLGEIEVEKMEKTHWHRQHFATNYFLARHRQPLVSPSDMVEMPETSGYLKYGNQVVRLRLPRIELAEAHERFIPRAFLPESKQLPIVPESHALESPRNRQELIVQPQKTALQPKLPPQSAPQSSETKPERFLY